MGQNVKIPEFIKSSKGDGSVSRTYKGIVGTLVFIVVSYTSITQQETLAIVNNLAMAASGIYAVYGVVMKIYNRFSSEKK